MPSEQTFDDARFHRNQPWRRFAFTAPMSAAAIVLLLIGSTMIKPDLSKRPQYNAIEARIVEFIPPPQPAGLEGGPAQVVAKSKPAEKAHPKPQRISHPHKVEAAPAKEAPRINSDEVSGSATGPSVATTMVAPSGGAGGIAGGAGIGNGAGLGNDSAGAHAIYAPLPKIPDELREDVFAAVAIAHFRISPEGEVEVTLLKPTPDPRLNQILLNTLRLWKFFPAMRDGVAINSEFDVRIPVSVE